MDGDGGFVVAESVENDDLQKRPIAARSDEKHTVTFLPDGPHGHPDGVMYVGVRNPMLSGRVVDLHATKVAIPRTSRQLGLHTPHAGAYVARVAAVWGSKTRCSILTCAPRVLTGRG